MSEFIAGVMSSLSVVMLLYVIYSFAYRVHAQGRATAACWWLPAWKCFRLVIRNMEGSTPVASIRYRTWLREDRPAVPGSSVKTWVDHDLTSGERIVLPPHEDLTTVSFRCEESGNNAVLVLTDKFGIASDRLALRPEHGRLMLEYTLRMRMWFLFTADVSRVYEFRRYQHVQGQTEDLFRTLLPEIQRGGEGEVRNLDLTDVTSFISV